MNRDVIQLVVAEDALCAEASLALIRHCGMRFDSQPTVTNGVDRFWERMPEFNRAAEGLGPILAIGDHDDARSCVGRTIAEKVPTRSRNLILRLAVVEIESWILADHVGVATRLGVASAKVPPKPDHIDDPKQALVNLARASRKSEIIKQVVPRAGSSAQIGPAYNLFFIDFLSSTWSIERAVKRSDSLARAVRAIEAIRRRN
jgi:hypothetical protein